MTTVLRIARRLPLLLVPLIVFVVGGEARAGEYLLAYERESADPLGLSAQIAPGLSGCAAGCATLRIPARVAVAARRQAVLQFAAPAGTTIVDGQVRLRVRTRQPGVTAKVQARFGSRWIDQARVRSPHIATRTTSVGGGGTAVAVALVAESAIPRGAVRAEGDNLVQVESVVLRVRDASPPALRWEDDPAGGSWLRGALCAALAGEDVGLGIDRLEYAVGPLSAVAQAPVGSRLQPRPAAFAARPCVDTSRLPDGTYGTVAAAVDGTGDGNRSTLTGGLVRVDNTPPEAVFVGPADPEARLPELRLVLHDAASGVDSTRVAVDGLPVVATLLRGELRFTPPQPLIDGLHLVTWQVEDAAGNRTDGREVVAVRDQTAPAIDDVAPNGASGADAEIRARVVDAGAGVAPDGVRIAVDGLDMTAAASYAEGYLRLRHPLGWAPGDHAVQVVAHDRSGNRALATWAFSVPPPPADPAPAPVPAGVEGAIAGPTDATTAGARLRAPRRLVIAGARAALVVEVETEAGPVPDVAVLAIAGDGRRVAAGVTDRDGVVRLSVPRSAGASLRVVALDAETEIAIEAPPAVRLRTVESRVAVGRSVRLVGNAPARARVLIEARARGRWVTVVRVAADRGGAFATPVRLPVAGTYAVRARVGSSVSAALRLTAA